MLRAVVRTYREAFSGLPRAVWLLSAAALVNRSGTMVLPFLALFLTAERGFTAAGAGRMLALYGLGALVGSWLGGWLCDRFETTRVMVWSLASTGLGFLLLGAVEHRAWISVLIVLLSIVGEGFRPASSAAVAAASPPGTSTRSFALFRLAINVGMTLGPAVGGLLALYDYFWLFVIDGATCLLAAGFVRYFFPPQRVPVAAAVVSPARRGGGSPWRDRRFLAMMFLNFVLSGVFFQVLSTFPLSLRDLYGFSEDRIGFALAVNTLVVVLFEMALVHSLAGRSALEIAGLGSFFTCLGFGLLPLGSGFAYVAFTVAVWSLGEMLSLPFVSGAVADRAGEGNVGRYMGFYVGAFSAAFVIAPLLGTWVYENLGPHALWFGCGALGLPLWAGFHALAVAERRSRERLPAAPAPAA